MSAPTFSIGMKFSRWEIIELEYNSQLCLCSCVCGTIKRVFKSALRSGLSKSCGCLKRENQGKASRKHGFTGHKLHDIWRGMLGRCFNPNNGCYARYGGRGIVVCEEWRNDFVKFYGWAISNGWEDGLQIERNNNEGIYEPINCSWATRKAQCRNRSNNKLIYCKGETKTISEFAERMNVPMYLISRRIRDGWGEEEAVLTPSRPQKKQQCAN